MKRILNVLGNVLLTILVILLIGYGWAFFEIKIMMKSNPELFGYVFYQQNTDDMATDFNIDDVIIIKKDEKYNIGDRIFYSLGRNEYKVSTVVHKDSLSTVTKCNTCLENDAPIDNSMVIGRVVGKLVFVGKFINFFKQKVVLVSIAVLGFIFVILSQYIQYKPHKKVASDK